MNRRATVVLVFGVLPLLVQAATLAPEEKAFKGQAEISNTALGGVRGSFINADQILYFGVEMYTEWRDGTGQLIASSGLNIGIDRSNGGPAVTVTHDVQAPDVAVGAASASNGQVSSGGLNQVQGVSQVVQTTGNGNGVTNNIGIDVGTQRPVIPGLTNPGGDETKTSQAGVTAQTFANGNSAGVIVTVPSQGMASQTVASMIGMQQRAQVVGDTNTVRNQLNMVIQVQNNSAVSAVQMNNLSQTVRGLWQAGLR